MLYKIDKSKYLISYVISENRILWLFFNKSSVPSFHHESSFVSVSFSSPRTSKSVGGGSVVSLAV